MKIQRIMNLHRLDFLARASCIVNSEMSFSAFSRMNSKANFAAVWGQIWCLRTKISWSDVSKRRSWSLRLKSFGSAKLPSKFQLEAFRLEVKSQIHKQALAQRNREVILSQNRFRSTTIRICFGLELLAVKAASGVSTMFTIFSHLHRMDKDSSKNFLPTKRHRKQRRTWFTEFHSC